MPTVKGLLPGFPTGDFVWDGRRLHRTYDEVWLVVADNESQGPYTVTLALAIPVGLAYSEDAEARAVKVGTAKRLENKRTHWHIPVHYTTQFAEEDANEANDPPDQRRARRRWSSTRLQVAFTKDAISGQDVKNSVGQVIEATTDITIPVLTIERFELGVFNPNTILNYENHINQTAFLGAPKHSVLLNKIEAEDDDSADEIFQGLRYQRVRYEFWFKVPITNDNKGWTERFANVGTYFYKVADDPTTIQAYTTDVGTDARQEVITGPLEDDGTKRAKNAALLIVNHDGSFAVGADGLRKHQEAEFADLNLV